MDEPAHVLSKRREGGEMNRMMQEPALFVGAVLVLLSRAISIVAQVFLPDQPVLYLVSGPFSNTGVALLFVVIAESIAGTHRRWFFLITGGVAVGLVASGLPRLAFTTPAIMVASGPLGLGFTTAAMVFFASARNHASRRRRTWRVLIAGVGIVALLAVGVLIAAHSGQAVGLARSLAALAVAGLAVIATCSAVLVWAHLERRAEEQLKESAAPTNRTMMREPALFVGAALVVLSRAISIAVQAFVPYQPGLFTVTWVATTFVTGPFGNAGVALFFVAITESIAGTHRRWFFLVTGGVAVGLLLLDGRPFFGLVASGLQGLNFTMFAMMVGSGLHGLGLTMVAMLFFAAAKNHVSRRRRAWAVLIVGVGIVALLAGWVVLAAHSIEPGAEAGFLMMGLAASLVGLMETGPAIIVPCFAGLVWARLERRAEEQITESAAPTS